MKTLSVSLGEEEWKAVIMILELFTQMAMDGNGDVDVRLSLLNRVRRQVKAAKAVEEKS
jgi:hypothetical protein